MPKAIHYAGNIDWDGGRVLAGWAACCSGERAVKIRREKQHTYDHTKVTCKSCLKMIEKHMARQARLAIGIPAMTKPRTNERTPAGPGHDASIRPAWQWPT